MATYTLTDAIPAGAGTTTEGPPQEPLSYADLATCAVPIANWLWQGYIARGNITLLTSQWKTGKTTLLSVLLSKLNTGGQLAGLNVAQGRAAIISEENPSHWHRRGQQLDFGPHACFFCRPFPGKPSRQQWHSFVQRLSELQSERNLDLAVIDTLSAVLPAGAESQVDCTLAALRPLEQLTRAGMAVLLLHHPPKGELRAGQAARGSGALSAYADVLVEMRSLARTGPHDRRRKLCAYSRHDDTPRELVIELAADHRDYAACPGMEDDDLRRGIEIVCEVLLHSDQQLTRPGILAHWPEARKPNEGTLWRWLDQALSLGLVQQAGAGRRGDPYRYCHRDHQLPWQPDPLEALDALLGL